MMNCIVHSFFTLNIVEMKHSHFISTKLIRKDMDVNDDQTLHIDMN